MADTGTRIGPTAIGATETTLVTVAASTTLHLLWYRIVNTAAAAVTIDMSIGADAAGTRLLDDFSIPVDGFHDWTGFLVLATGETLRATASATGCTFCGSGVNVT
jgi:hypothetical protein